MVFPGYSDSAFLALPVDFRLKDSSQAERQAFIDDTRKEIWGDSIYDSINGVERSFQGAET